MPVTTYGQGTNGLVYQQVVAPAPSTRLTCRYCRCTRISSPNWAWARGLPGGTAPPVRHGGPQSTLFSSLRAAVDDEQVVSGRLVFLLPARCATPGNRPA